MLARGPGWPLDCALNSGTEARGSLVGAGAAVATRLLTVFVHDPQPLAHVPLASASRMVDQPQAL